MGIDYYLHSNRRDFSKEGLMEEHLPQDPKILFAHWFQEALDASILDANAMTLSTVSEANKPSSRVVLMREFSDRGLIFYSNYKSEKAQELEKNPWASVNFFWASLDRQVRIEGKVTRLDQASSERYFQSRPRESQLGAWASSQSNILKNRADLEKAFHNYEQKFEGQTIPKPDYWGGYIIDPLRFEFWLGRPNRLHDRIVYDLINQAWNIYRLAP